MIKLISELEYEQEEQEEANDGDAFLLRRKKWLCHYISVSFIPNCTII